MGRVGKVLTLAKILVLIVFLNSNRSLLTIVDHFLQYFHWSLYHHHQSFSFLPQHVRIGISYKLEMSRAGEPYSSRVSLFFFIFLKLM